MNPSGLITLLTDFGTADAFVGIMKGVMLGINPAARFIDLSHAVPPQQVMPAALLLRSAVTFFPAGTIHLAVIDPAVGSERAALVIETAQTLFVGPDNGVLFPALASCGRSTAYRITNAALLRHPLSQTFHGRDVFAPVAAHLSCGLAPAQVGPVVDAIVDLPVPQPRRTATGVAGEVVYVDGFGNLITNIEAMLLSAFPASALSVSIEGARVVGPVTAYAAVPQGTPLALIGSWSTLEIAVRNGSAAQRFAAGPGTPVTVVLESRDT